MYNWRMPHVNSSLNVWGVALWRHTSFTEVVDRTLWSIKPNRLSVFLRKNLCEKKSKRTSVGFPSIFSIVFVWATRRKAMKRSWHLHSIYIGSHILGGPIYCQTLSSFSLIAELKHTLMHKSTKFPASRLFHLFWISAGSGSTRYHNTLSDKISSDRTSYYIGGLMHSMQSVFAENLNLSQALGHPYPYHTLLQSGFLTWLNPLVGSVRYLISLLRCTLPYYSVEPYPTFLNCWGTIYLDTLLSRTRS